MTGATLRRNCWVALGGLAAGATFMWLALDDIALDDVRVLVANLDRTRLAQAAALYWLGLAMRVLRWQRLLRQLAPAGLGAVGETLVVGYAINNVLPARLGEVARAAYAKRRLGIGRARVFGSIVIERLLDLSAILGCLVGGLLALHLAETATRVPTFELIALNAGAVVGVALLALAVLRSGQVAPLSLSLPAPVRTVIDDLRRGIRTLNRRSVLLALVLTVAVWLCEVAALALVFAAVGVELGVAEALLVMGAASLSTLVPTAPGYLGTYQLVAVLAMEVFGYAPSAGIVASGAIQLVLFGSVTVAGFAVLAVRAGRHAWRAALALAPGGAA